MRGEIFLLRMEKQFRLIIVSREEWGILGKEISPLIIIEWIYFVSQLENIYIYIWIVTIFTISFLHEENLSLAMYCRRKKKQAKRSAVKV